MAERENYYIVLGLDPAVSDPAAIDGQIRARQNQWSSDASTGIPSKARKADLYLKRLDEIRRVMSNPQERAAEAAAARRILAAASQGKADELAKAIEVICAEGHYTPEQLTQLTAKFKGSFTEPEIRAQLDRRCPCRDPRTAGPDMRLETIEPSQRNQIDTDLQVLGLKSLYEFLGAGPQTPAPLLREQAERINREILARGQPSPEANARKELCGLAATLFASEPQKARYDNTLALRAMTEMEPTIALAARDGLIGRAALNTLLDQALKARIDKDTALRYIADYARKRGWHLERGDALPAETATRCGVCGKAAERKDAPYCSDCGHPLSIPCPRCGTSTPTSARACAACGTLTGEAPVLLGWLKRGQELMEQDQFADAVAEFERILTRWPNWPQALEARATARQRIGAREAVISRIAELVNDKRLFAAREALESLQRTQAGSGDDALAERIARTIEAADQAYRAGETARTAGRPEDAFDRYSEALSLTVDHPDAGRAMAAMPPPAPSALVAELTPTGARLTWTAAPARGLVTYRVLGKTGAAPAHADDGQVLGETAATGLADPEMPIGEPRYYAVYGLRKTVWSRLPAITGPHLRIAEVSGLVARPGSGEVLLSWNPPPRCRRVVVRRGRNEDPASATNGEGVPTTPRSAHDSGLVNGETYRYRVFVQYDDPVQAGRLITTPGLALVVTPAAPPPAVTDLRARRQGNSIALTWTPPPGVSVQVRRGRAPPAWQPGQVVALEQIDRLGEPVPTPAPGSAQIVLDAQGEFFFTPVSIKGSIAVVGHATSLTTIDDIANLIARANGHNIILTWDWPPGLETVRVLRRHDTDPQSWDDPRALADTVTQAQYQRGGCWQLLDTELKPHYFRVFAKVPNRDAYSGGVAARVLFGKTPVVRYRVEIKRNLWRRLTGVWLRLQSTEITQLPGVKVVIANGHVPLAPSGGQLACSLPQVDFAQGLARIPIPEQFWGGNRFANLFFANSDAGGAIRLMPEGTEQLRIG